MKIAHTITPPEWMRAPDLICLMDILNKGNCNARLVGGCIRNHLMGKPIQDVDVACIFSPDETIKNLNEHGIRTIPTGIKHGTINAHINGQNYEITTLRQDVKTDGRHADIQFTDNWVEDAKRRDFTINALYADRDGSIYDPLGDGLNDIDNKIVRFIGNPEHRIHEDYLRILRFFRFASHYGADEPHTESFEACKKLKDNISRLSDERIADELFKILSRDHADNAIAWMHDCDLFDIPQSASKHLKSLIQLQTQLNCTDLNSRYYISEINKKYIRNNKIIKFFNHMDKIKNNWDFNIKKALYLQDRHDVIQALLILKAEGLDIPDHLISDAMTHKTPEFPIIAHDIMDHFKIPEGQEVGQKLKQAEGLWIDSGFKLSRDEILEKIA